MAYSPIPPGFVPTAIRSIDVSEVESGEAYSSASPFSHTESVPRYVVRVTIETADAAWIQRFAAWCHGEAMAEAAPALPSAVPALPQGPIDGILEDE